MSTAVTTSAKDSTEPKPGPQVRGWFPPWPTCVSVAVLLTLIPLVRIFAEQIELVISAFDGAVLNIVTLILSFIASLILYIWFCWRSSYSFSSRRVVFAAPIVLILLHTALRRYEGVDGYMIPIWSWRWERNHEDALRNRPVEPEAPPLPQPAVAENQPATPTPPKADLKTETAEDFPQFLGPQRNNYLPAPELASDWTKRPPRELWRRDVGPGWSGFAVRNGYAVTMEQRDKEEWVTCYRVDTGEPVWHHAAPGRHEEALGGLGPRATPTIDEGRVFVQGATGLVRCLDGSTGELIWEDDLLKRYGLTQTKSEGLVKWGRAGSPLIVGDLVVVPAGGAGDKVKSLIAYYKAAGKGPAKVAWEAGTDQISYASPVLTTLGGIEQIVTVNEVTVTGHDVGDGRVLWSYDRRGNSAGDANVSQALPLPNDRIFVSKGYGGGAALLQLTNNNGQCTVEPIWESRRVLKTKFTNITVIAGHGYGLSDGVLECVDLESGKSRWRGGRYGHGQLLGVSSHLLVLGEDGELMLVAADPNKFQELGKIDALTGLTWNNPCLAGHRLILRNGKQAACYELP